MKLVKFKGDQFGASKLHFSHLVNAYGWKACMFCMYSRRGNVAIPHKLPKCRHMYKDMSLVYSLAEQN